MLSTLFRFFIQQPDDKKDDDTRVYDLQNWKKRFSAYAIEKAANQKEMIVEMIAAIDQFAVNTLDIVEEDIKDHCIDVIRSNDSHIRDYLYEALKSSLPVKMRIRLAVYNTMSGQPDSLFLAQTCHDRGDLYRLQQQWPQSLAEYKHSLQIYQRLSPNSLDEAKSYERIGKWYLEQGKFIAALGQYHRCALVRERLPDDQLALAETYEQIARLSDKLGKFDDFMHYKQKIIDILKQPGQLLNR